MIVENNTPGFAVTQYSGLQPITVDAMSNGNYRLEEQRKTTNNNMVSIMTLNCNGGTNFGNAIDFTNDNSTFINSTWNSYNTNSDALDAHWGIEMTLDFWSSVFKRNSFDNKGATVKSFLHYKSFGQFPQIAQWDASSLTLRFMSPNPTGFPNGITALDIISHEFGHSINSYTANLRSTSGGEEQDALNEGLSDIWAA